jgi:hypothetical protein
MKKLVSEAHKISVLREQRSQTMMLSKPELQKVYGECSKNLINLIRLIEKKYDITEEVAIKIIGQVSKNGI